MPAGWVALLAFSLLLLRAWPRLFYPEVWDEDGTRNLIGFLAVGLADLLKPVNGYLIFIPKLITMLSASMSFVLYPLISTLFAWVFTVLVLVFLAKAPMHLKGGFFLALSCMLIPSDPEAFGLPLYTFWWSALLLYALIFWGEPSKHFGLRSLLIMLSSLSSPACLATLPLFWVRALVLRKSPAELKLAIVASFSAAMQLWTLWPIAKGGGLGLKALSSVIPAFLGSYAVGNIFPNLSWVFGLLILAYVLTGTARNASSWVLWALGYLWVASVLMSITRVDIGNIHPVLAGPRYFFFPFIILSWFFLQLVIIDKRNWFRALGGFFLALSIANATPVLVRKHDDLNWLGHISSCPHFAKYRIPVHFDGNSLLAWNIEMQGDTCAELIREDLFAGLVPKKTYPYRVLGRVTDLGPMLEKLNIPKITRISSRDWPGVDHYSSASGHPGLPMDYEIVGSSSKRNSESGMTTVGLERGEQILFRTDSGSGLQRISIVGQGDAFFEKALGASGWIVLDFSSRLLPEKFEVQFIDGGDGRGEWSAIGLKKTTPP